MKNGFVFLYGLIAYAAALASLTYLTFFVVGILSPTTIDTNAQPPSLMAFQVNFVLLAIFGLSHTIMARPFFKSIWTKLIPAAAERSTYVLVSAVCLGALIVYWQPMSGTIWQTSSQAATSILTGIALLGWVLVVYSTFVINHFDLFGLRQVWLNLRGIPYSDIEMKEPLLYKIVRHPMQLGILIGVWVTPAMTISHLYLAVGFSTYIFIGLVFEERDLIKNFGEQYRSYRERTPAIFPSLRKLNRK